MWKLLCDNDLSLRVGLLLVKTTDSNLFFPSLVPIQTDVVPMWVAKTCLNNIPNCADREIVPQLGQHFCFVRQPHSTKFSSNPGTNYNQNIGNCFALWSYAEDFLLFQ